MPMGAAGRKLSLADMSQLLLDAPKPPLNFVPREPKQRGAIAALRKINKGLFSSAPKDDDDDEDGDGGKKKKKGGLFGKKDASAAKVGADEEMKAPADDDDDDEGGGDFVTALA